VTAPREYPYLIILTGLSGSGKTVALNTFEDGGFFCVDNLPTSLIDTFVSLTQRTSTISKIAIGVDIRERKFLPDFTDMITSLRKKYRMEIIYLEADEEVLVRRFKETRRPHPLGYRDLKRALTKERELLSPIRKEADRIIDTSSFSPHDLRRFISDRYLTGTQEMKVSIISFGYKYGIPPEADIVFDVRFLPNPNFVEELKRFTGKSKKVKDYVLSKPETQEFLARLRGLLVYLIPQYRQEGRSYLTIAIGCTGGRHRSPAICEVIRDYLRQKKFKVSITHRDLHE